MSRSYRKNSIAGISKAKSEKKDKQSCNKKLRRKIRQIMVKEQIEDWLFPLPNEIQNPYTMAKDGKIYFNRNEFPKVLQK